MFVDPLERAADLVLADFHLASFTRHSLGNAGGFSGARIWKVDATNRSLCLKVWPSELKQERLARVHSWMGDAREAGLRFVPEVFRKADGSSWRLEAGRLWDLTEWMPGTANFHENPSSARIAAACSALASLHEVWRRPGCQAGPCPAVLRRLAALAEWRELLQSGWRPTFGPEELDPVAPLANKAWPLILALTTEQEKMLEPYRNIHMRLQPCLSDIWHDHVLFTGDVISGIIDYGSMRIDSPATDLARLLGSLAGDDELLFQAGMNAYRSICGPNTPDAEFVRILDHSGTVIAVAQWLRWLYLDGRQFEDRNAVARRLGNLVTRLERWAGPDRLEV